MGLRVNGQGCFTIATIMKKAKILTVILLLVASLMASAQVKIGLRAGGGINSLHFNVPTNVAGANYETSSGVGIVVGAALEAMIPGSPIGFDAGVLFSWRNASVTDYSSVSGIGNGEGIPRNLNRGYMEFPILFKWKIINKGSISPHIATGPNFSFLCGKSLSDPFKKNGVNTGWLTSAGVQLFGHYQLDISYGFGLAKAFERLPMNTKDFVPTYAKDRHWRATLTYYF